MRREPGLGPRGSGIRVGFSTSGGLRRKSVGNLFPDAAFPDSRLGLKTSGALLTSQVAASHSAKVSTSEISGAGGASAVTP